MLRREEGRKGGRVEEACCLSLAGRRKYRLEHAIREHKKANCL